MRQLFFLVFKYRVFLVFLFLEIVALWLVVNQNNYQRVAFASSSSKVVGTIDAFTSDITYFVKLRDANDTLMNENARLRKLVNTLYSQVKDLPQAPVDKSYNFSPARVINNSVYRANNYITINKGTLDGIEPGMGVISSEGIVGQVKNCSENFSTVYSALHTKLLISAQLKRHHVLGTAKWNTGNPEIGSLEYIPRNVEVAKGDTIITSGFNSTYPEGIVIGTVTEVGQGESESFLGVNFSFATDFKSLSYVYVVDYLLKEERSKLEEEITE